jgi:hypothetical protein
MWSGTIATIPFGWALCDGNNGTPNLVDKFIVGAKQDDTVAKTNVTGSLTQSGGSATADLSHDHTTTIIDSGPEGAAADTGGVLADKGEHEHTISSGGSATQSILPPYFALAFIMKL